MTIKSSVVLTSIAAPNNVMRQIAEDCQAADIEFIVIGDTKSPADFTLDGCQFVGVDDQLKLQFKTPALCPTRHYARKNIGYLMAIQNGAEVILETDDDNMPSADFYKPLPIEADVAQIEASGDATSWVNVYRYFDDRLIWPRGLPLDAIHDALPERSAPQRVRIPIQQGLADENPDVDAIYRLVMPLPFDFQRRERLALGKGAWCPFNSQNTAFYREAFPLLYLPAHCSFRMTDIWRSFVAQRIGWVNGWSILFREATVVQDRNDHSLMRDFADEVSGYNGNRAIAARLDSLELAPGAAALTDNLRICYRALVEDGHVGVEELPLLDAWIEDLAALGIGS
jgi:hypothetical protein